MPAYLTAAFYKFVDLPDAAQLKAPLLACCERHAVKGLILLANEGINSTIAGPAEGVKAVLASLRQDPRLDLDRAGVMGRSYGGYMTLTLAGRHPELWRGAVDMFGPYDLFSFMRRIPETWKTYFYQALGHPEKDKDFLTARSPSTHLHNLACPMLVIQGANDPRVVEAESRDLVETLRQQGKQIDYLVFGDEGHDVLKFTNKVICYNRITEFFKTTLL